MSSQRRVSGTAVQRNIAILGSAVFFVVAPCTLAGLVPWSITGWQLQPPFLVDYETFCQIRDDLIRQKLTITQTARALGLSARTVAKWAEVEHYRPRVSAVRVASWTRSRVISFAGSTLMPLLNAEHKILGNQLAFSYANEPKSPVSAGG